MSAPLALVNARVLDPLAGARVFLDRERFWLVLKDGEPVAGTALRPPFVGASDCIAPRGREGSQL